MEAQPLRIVPSSDNNAGCVPQKKIDRGSMMAGVEEKMSVVKEESSAIKLGLGVGAAHWAAAISPVIAREKCLFTEAQRRELEHQAFIFKHFAHNLPVPQHLVLPILNSVASTSGSGFGGLCEQFPSLIGFYRQGFDYGNMMDPEPHRCRRTDGKKWRCGKNVVPDQKYCERHMHRGRSRSRKLVETSEANSSLRTKPYNKLHAKLGSNTESAVPIENPLGIQLINPSSCTPSSSLCTLDTFSTDTCKNNIVFGDNQSSFSPATVAFPSSTPTTAAVPAVATISVATSTTSNKRSNLNISKKYDNAQSCIISNRNIARRSSGNGSILDGSNIFTGIGFSPRSVLQVSWRNHSYLYNRNSTELEPGRCRRTDGKKWRCKNAVLPDQKYCATHMHRGAKKRFADHEPATVPLSSAVTIARLPLTTSTTNIRKVYCTVPNTNLSMSIPSSAALIQSNESSPSSSGTDTTITDTMDEYSCASY